MFIDRQTLDWWDYLGLISDVGDNKVQNLH